jgi:hypothetical protein
VPSTDAQALLIDLTIAHRASLWEFEHGVGEWWWVSILKALGGGGTGETKSKPQQQQVRWF